MAPGEAVFAAVDVENGSNARQSIKLSPESSTSLDVLTPALLLLPLLSSCVLLLLRDFLNKFVRPLEAEPVIEVEETAGVSVSVQSALA